MMADHKCQAFNSGNPVFDAFVTVVTVKNPEMDIWDEIHAKLLSLAEKEPGGLLRSRCTCGAVAEAAPARK